MSVAPAGISILKDVISVTPNGGRGPRVMSADISSSNDDINTRVRKPYTITKQREKWTDQEHQKFLEALKLYGRSWYHIKEHIGTKTTVQIRSHAQKFFVKVERGVSNNDVNGEIQEIEIPPPRPKRKPSHPYPRKAGSSPTLVDKNGDALTNYSSAVNVEQQVANKSSKRVHGTRISPAPSEDGNDQGFLEELRPSTTKSNSASTGYPLPANPPVFSAPLHSNGLTLEGNDLPGIALGSPEVGNPKNMEPVSDLSDKVALQNDQRSPCTKKDLLTRPQTGMYDERRGKSKKSSDLPIHIHTILPVYCEVEVPRCDSRVHAESRHPYIHLHKKQESDPHYPTNLSSQNSMETSTYVKAKACEQSFPHNSNPVSMLIDSYGSMSTSGSLQTALPDLTHDHLIYPTSPWQFMQAPFMNHPAAFAAAMAAAAWAMRGSSGSNVNQLPSPEDINVAVFAAASASWWAVNGLAQHTHNQFTGGTFRPSHMQSTVDSTNTTKERVLEEPCSGEKERTVLPSISPETHKAQEKLLAESEKICCSIPDMAAKHPGPSADDLDMGEQTVGEGSSNGSNTPALLSNSSEQDTPSLSENDNDENAGLCIPGDDGRKRGFQALVGDGCIKLKANTSERGRPQQKESRHGEHDNGKRLKSSNHETDFRKEVSSQGRKAFEALFTCRTLPQTFSREAERSNMALLSEEMVRQKVSNHVEDLSASQAEVMMHNEIDWSSECTLMTESNEPKAICLKPSGTTSDVDMFGTCSSLNNKPRASISGFIPYQKSVAKSRACLSK